MTSTELLKRYLDSQKNRHFFISNRCFLIERQIYINCLSTVGTGDKTKIMRVKFKNVKHP